MVSLWWTFYYTSSGLLKPSRKSHMVQTNKYFISKNPLTLCMFLQCCNKPPKKTRLGPRNPSPQPSPTANSVPVFPGGCLAPAGSLGLPSSSVSTAVPAPWAWLLVSLYLAEPALEPKQVSFLHCDHLEKHGLISDKAPRGE